MAPAVTRIIQHPAAWTVSDLSQHPSPCAPQPSPAHLNRPRRITYVRCVAARPPLAAIAAPRRDRPRYRRRVDRSSTARPKRSLSCKIPAFVCRWAVGGGSVGVSREPQVVSAVSAASTAAGQQPPVCPGRSGGKGRRTTQAGWQWARVQLAAAPRQPHPRACQTSSTHMRGAGVTGKRWKQTTHRRRVLARAAKEEEGLKNGAAECHRHPLERRSRHHDRSTARAVIVISSRRQCP